jgi:hypothetical protein
MRNAMPRLPRTALLGLLLLPACDRSSAELVEEINAAREGCTEEQLKAASEECVQMMERYAEMGTEAIEGYIGAVRSLDQALRRMPAAQFDTAGVGHAISPGLAPQAWGDSSRQPQGVYPSDPSFSRQRAVPYSDPRYDEPAYPRDDRYGGADAYGPRYGNEPYGYGPGYDPRDPYARDPRGYGEPGGAYDRARAGGRSPAYPDRYGRDARATDPRAYPPARGQLLPPEQRLRRPWLDDDRGYDSRYNRGYDPRGYGVDPRWQPRYDEWADSLDWEAERRYPRRDPGQRYPR